MTAGMLLFAATLAVHTVVSGVTYRLGYGRWLRSRYWPLALGVCFAGRRLRSCERHAPVPPPGSDTAADRRAA